MAYLKRVLRILVIDNNEDGYLLLNKYLTKESENFLLTRACCVTEAKRILKNSFNNLDLVLYNLNQLGPASVNSIKEILSLSSKLPVIIITENSSKEFGLTEFSLGISDYLIKEELSRHQLVKSIYLSLERKKIENQLKVSEEKYKSLFDFTPLPMWVLSRGDFKFLSVNDAAIELYGFSREEFLQMHIRDIWASKTEPEIEDIIKERKDDYYRIKVHHRKKNGEKIYLEVQSNPIIFEGIPARVSLVNNITAQVEAERALILSEQRFKALVQDGSDLVSILDFNGCFKYVSPSAKTVTGISSEGLMENNLFDLIHKQDRDTVKEYFHELKQTKRKQIPPYRIKSSDGTWRWIETIATNLLLDPAVQGIVTNSRDITEIIEQEKKLIESLQRYDIVAKATSDTITDFDIENNKISYNEGIENMFGYKKCSIDYSGEWWDSKVHPEDITRVKKRVKNALRKGDSQIQIEYRFLCNDGNYKHIWDRSYIVKDKTGKPVRIIGSMQDVTTVQEYIKEIESHNARLKDIAWTQSHVVRAPLARIMGIIDLLQNQRDVEGKLDLIENIISSAYELDQILRNISNKTGQLTIKGM